ncbi:MAG: hypothetical protein OEZ68_15800 [Gammaproteobacteria bacterium]|nr:hypothetical protein [Gammaproteobacteria bacterium]MDH5802265.1 hypothetical protein [Gammaproteobacteria bacterium]
MNKPASFFLLAVFALFMSGCATVSHHMSPVPPANVVDKAAADKALVVFLRPSNYGGAVQATLYDGDTYIGTLSAKKQIAYETDPGEHMFMVVGESADFMKADLLAGKTYYAQVVARMGLWKARFSFRPMNGQVAENELQQWLSASEQVSVNQEGLAWAKANAASIAEKKADYLPKWEAKPDSDKQILKAESGR